jgi:hypothetical protein
METTVGASIFSRLIEALCSGDWLTRARMRRWGLAVLVAGTGGLAYLVASAGVRPLRWTVLGGSFDRLPGAVILELCWA